MKLTWIKMFLFVFPMVYISCKAHQNIHNKTIDKEDKIYSNIFENEMISLDILPQSFYNQLWVHRHEEDTDQHGQYFRPVKTSILASLYRNQLFFKTDSTCQYRWLSPVDAHKMKDASWLFDNGKIYILENSSDIIDTYEILWYSDSLMILSKQSFPQDRIYGKWHLISSGDQDLSHHGYTISFNGDKVEVSNNIGLLHTYDMSHSARKLQEPLALNFDPTISKLYPWLASGQYGIFNDTLVLELANDNFSKFIR